MEWKNVSFDIPTEVVEAMDKLVEKGIYLNRGEIIREVARNEMIRRGIESFVVPMQEFAETITKVTKPDLDARS